MSHRPLAPSPFASVVLVSCAALVFGLAFACSSAPGEKHAKAEQRVETAESEAGACAHPICSTGEGLQPACDSCASALCAQDPYCCNVTWDATCVGEVGSICGVRCTPPPAEDSGTSTCAHAVCAAGGALVSGCEPCSAQLCAQDPYCCAVTWDATCVGEVTSICGLTCN